MTPIEAVARALAKADGKDPDAPAWIRYPGQETYGICWRDQYAKKARAAIEAMHEPTDEMLDAADDVQHKCLEWSLEPGEGLDGMNWIPAWQAMISTALKEDAKP